MATAVAPKLFELIKAIAKIASHVVLESSSDGFTLRLKQRGLAITAEKIGESEMTDIAQAVVDGDTHSISVNKLIRKRGVLLRIAAAIKNGAPARQAKRAEKKAEKKAGSKAGKKDTKNKKNA